MSSQGDNHSNDPEDPLRWTIIELLQWTTDYFKRYSIDSPRTDAEVLLCHCMGCERIDLYLKHDQPLNRIELASFKRLIKRRVQHEPVAFIIGVKEFWSLPFKVTSDVLIPRPDTECLVETALKYLPETAVDGRANVLELGVGSGAVIVALAHERSHCRFWGSDRSQSAAQLARVNAQGNGVDHVIRFFTSNWFDAIVPGLQCFDMIISNPPYIPTADVEKLSADITGYEPIGALDGGADGLDDIRLIIENARHYLKDNGCLLLEIGFDQRVGVASIVSGCSGFDKVIFHKDLSGHDRVAEIRKRK